MPRPLPSLREFLETYEVDQDGACAMVDLDDDGDHAATFADEFEPGDVLFIDESKVPY